MMEKVYQGVGKDRVQEPGKNYPSRTFIMPTGLVLRITLDEWYFQMFDWLIAPAQGYDAESIIASTYEASKAEPSLSAQDAFEKAFGITMQYFYLDHKDPHAPFAGW
ncbi:hypothetical protein GC177_00525 [bacterium]|nr:hypothetical protein [bacterium]